MRSLDERMEKEEGNEGGREREKELCVGWGRQGRREEGKDKGLGIQICEVKRTHLT